MWSVIVGAAGAVGSWVVAAHLKGKIPGLTARRYWLIGLAAFFPAWLVSFLALLQPATQVAEAPLPPRALLSSGAGLAGIIVTDYLLRWLQKSGRSLPPFAFWTLGVVSLLPAWLIALVKF